MGWIGCVCCEKFQHNFVARTFAPVDPFCTECCRAKNGPKCKIVRNVPKHEFRVQWGGSVAFVAKNSDVTSWHELLHQFGLFRTEFCNATNCPKYTQIVRNATKHVVRVQWGGSSGLL